MLSLALTAFSLSLSAQPAVDDPFATLPTDADDTTDAPEEVTAIDLSQYSPAIQAVLERERTTPAEQLQGVLLLVELGEPELARPLLDQLLVDELDSQTQAALARQFGTHRMLKLALAESLGERARVFAMSAMEHYAEEVRSPERLRQLIAQLADPLIDNRYAAISGLLQADRAAAVALVSASGEASDPNHQRWIRLALAELAPSSHGPLLAGLGAAAGNIRSQSAEILGHVAPSRFAVHLVPLAVADSDPQVRDVALRAVERLLGQAPTTSHAERILQQVIDQHLSGTIPLDLDENGHVEVWYWDAANDSPAVVQLELSRAHILAAARLAEALVRLVPASTAYQTQAMTLQLATADLGLPQAAWSDSLDETELQTVVLGAMQMGLDLDLPRAIVESARILGEMRDASALLRHAPVESPLVRALSHPSRAVRWVALSAIMQLNPQSSYPGASRTRRALADFVAAGMQPRAVVALRSLEQTRTLAASVAARGYDVATVTRGKEVIAAAAEQGGADLVLVDARISQPTVREVLFQLRGNPTTAGAVVGILGAGDALESARQAARDHDHVLAFAHPQDDQSVEDILARLDALQVGLTEYLPSRSDMTRQALAWLDQLARDEDTIYDVHLLEGVLFHAMDNLELTGEVTGILAQFGSHESQRRLVNLASSRTLPIELREQAAAAFRTSMRQFGLQLTKSEILRQYDLYNASESADRQTQTVLGHVLDTVEMNRAGRQQAGE